jgi:hypothetical protein
LAFLHWLHVKSSGFPGLSQPQQFSERALDIGSLKDPATLSTYETEKMGEIAALVANRINVFHSGTFH